MDKLVIAYTAATVQGSRAINQDNLRAGSEIPFAQTEQSFSVSGEISAEPMQIFCVCDGIGGEARGELASREALEAIDESLKEEAASLRDAVIQAAEAAQKRVQNLYRDLGVQGGCTLTMVGICAGQYVFLNIGDSPAFYYDRQNNTLQELTVRHNLEWLKRQMGMEPEWGDSACLMRYLGKFGKTAEELAHISEGTLQSGDSILLCSDGITEAFSQEVLAKKLKKNTPAGVLAEYAGKQPESDNCTALCLMVRGS